MRPTVGKVLHAGEAEPLSCVEEDVHQAERVGAVDAGEHGRALDHGSTSARHLDHDLVGIAIGHQPGERAAAGHAVAAGVVDDDEIDAAGLLALGGEAGAGAAADDGLAPGDHGRERVEQGGSREARHGSAPAGCAAGAAVRARPGMRGQRRGERGSLMW